MHIGVRPQHSVEGYAPTNTIPLIKAYENKFTGTTAVLVAQVRYWPCIPTQTVNVTRSPDADPLTHVTHAMTHVIRRSVLRLIGWHTIFARTLD